MASRIIRTEHAPAPIGPYNQGVVASGSFLFVAGQIPIDPKSGQVIQGDIKAQTRQVLNNLKAIVESGSGTLESVVKTTIFLSDMGEFAAMNEVYAEFFKTNPPARSTVEVARLPKDVRIEIDAIAVVKS